MKVLKSLSVVLALFVAQMATAQKLDAFGSSIEKTVGPKTIKVPYTDVVTYLGYAAPGNEDEVKDNKKFYYIYIWIPAVAPELGVRMMSPVPTKYKGLKKATEAQSYKDNKSSSDFFDTYITIEKSNILKKDKINNDAVSNASWTVLEFNDDSREMPANPSKRTYNSLLRYKSEASNPTKALTAGLYRIGFTTFKRGEVKGTFLAEVAAPVKLPGVAMAKTIDELLAQLNEQ